MMEARKPANLPCARLKLPKVKVFMGVGNNGRVNTAILIRIAVKVKMLDVFRAIVFVMAKKGREGARNDRNQQPMAE